MGSARPYENNKRIDAAVKDLRVSLAEARRDEGKDSRSRIQAAPGDERRRESDPERKRMYEFFDRLISIVIPRIRDFRAFPPGPSTGEQLLVWADGATRLPGDQRRYVSSSRNEYLRHRGPVEATRNPSAP